MGSESKGLSSSSSSWSPATKKMIQNLKEIVNCPEPEIYAVLSDCDMNPDDAVQRLLSQDTFHEVKSKRERRKEMKETQESRPRVNHNGSAARGIRGASERSTGWSGSIQRSYEENDNYAPNHKGDNLLVAPSLPVPHLTYNVKGVTSSQRQPLTFHSTSLHTDGRGQFVAEASHGSQPAWLGTSSGQLSMADIVRMGMPNSKGSQISSEASSHTHLDDRTKAKLHHDLHPQNETNVSGMVESDYTVCQKSCLDEWNVVEQRTAASGSSTLEASVVSDADKHSNSEGFKPSESSHSRGVKAPEGNLDNGYLISDYVVTASASGGQKSESRAAGTAHSDDSDPGSVSNFSDPDCSAALNNDVGAVSDAAAKLRQLSVGEEQQNNCSVVLPSHLQALAADCSHLSFGTFRSGNNSSSTVLSPSDLSKDVREASTTVDALSRNMGYASAEESLESHSACTDAPNYNLSTEVFAEEVEEQDVSAEALGRDFIRPPPHDSIIENIGHSSTELSFARTDPIIGNHSIQNQPHTYIESQPSDVLMSKLQSLRAAESLQAQLQSIPSRHGDSASSFSSRSISFSEDRQPPSGAFSLSPPSSVIPNQHRIAPSYPQSKHFFEQPTNTAISYSGLPQSYSQFASTFQQQAYPGRDEVHQPLADLKSLPQYRATSRIPGASDGTGYGSYGSSSNVLGRYPYNTPPPMVANSGYNGSFRPQYSDRDTLASLQQNSSSSTRNQGSSSRMQPTAEELAFYNLLKDYQQYAGFRQDERLPSQYHGALGYSDRYQSQLEVARDHQQQHFGGSAVGGAQRGPSSHQLHQFWQQH